MPSYKGLDLPPFCDPAANHSTYPRASLNDAGEYVAPGAVWRTCPRLLELDPRHGLRHDLWPQHTDKTRPGGAAWRSPTIPVRVNGKVQLDNNNAVVVEVNPDWLVDLEGHDSNTFAYVPGNNPPRPDQIPKCLGCGRGLVCTDGDPI